MFIEYLVYRCGETPGGKRKAKGSGRGAFKVISKLYWGHNIIDSFMCICMYVCNSCSMLCCTSWMYCYDLTQIPTLQARIQQNQAE